MHRLVPRRTRLTPPFAAALLAVLVAAAGSYGAEQAPPPTTPLLAEIADARPLDDIRTGVSEREPEYCRDEIYRETNPAAANKSSIEVGPPKFLVEGLEPGTSWRHCVSIYNRSPEPRTVEVSTLDVVGSPDPDVRLQTREPVGVGAWIELPVQQLELDPGERVLLPYLLRVPADPPGGTSTAGISVADTTDVGGPSAGARITRRLVTQLQVTMPGGETADPTIDDIRAPRLIWTGRDSSRARIRFNVTNEGSVVDTVTPGVQVDGLFGRDVATVSGTPEVMIPKSAQEFVLVWEDLPWIGVYSPKIVVRSATGTQQVDVGRVWILPPWWALLAFVGAVMLAAFGVVRARRRSGYAVEGDWDEWDDEEHH